MNEQPEPTSSAEEQPEPTSSAEEQRRYKEAKKRVAKLRSLYSYLGVYVIVNGILIAIWAMGDRDSPWFIWPMLGMAVPLAWMIYDIVASRYGASWEEKKIRKYMSEGEGREPPAPPS